MTILIKQAKIIAPQSPYHHQVQDILIEDGIIQQIKKSINLKTDYLIKHSHLMVSVGWIDGTTSFGEPGFEERETLNNGLFTAAKAGFTHVVLQPSTNPVIDDAAKIAYIIQKTKTNIVNVLPIGALTKQSKGEQMAEMFDMHQAGAVAFADYQTPIKDSLLLKICLQYLQDFNGLMMPFCQDTYLMGKGYVNEGVVATKLGLKGIPSIAEAVAVARNLTLLKYTGGKMHIPLISTAEAVALIKQAKAEGLAVTCSVAAHHLALTDETLAQFDANFKILPPLRDKATQKALINAVLEGVIDLIVTDHFPIDVEHKKIEFDLASFGTIGLESIFGALNKLIPIDILIQKLTNGYQVFEQQIPQIKEGERANLTCFETQTAWQFSLSDINSSSKNSAFIGYSMQGKPLAIIHNNQIITNG